MSEENKKISQLFLERNQFVVIGLTGRTGSGCTTAANILESDTPRLPNVETIKYNKEIFYTNLDAKRYAIVKKYTEQNWLNFYSIKVSDLISAYFLLLSIEDAKEFVVTHCDLKEHLVPELLKVLTSGSFSTTHVKRKFKNLLNLLINHCEELRVEKSDQDKFISFLKLIRKFTLDFKLELRKIDEELYISLYQSAGNSIRRTGLIIKNYDAIDFSPVNVFALPETINRVIKIIRQIKKRAFIVIDAIRNPYEAKFFKERYSAFYLVSINAPDIDRIEYLKNVHKFTSDQLIRLDKIESGKTKLRDAAFTHQNVKKCIEISDIHIFNPRGEIGNNNVLRAQLGWYVALMMHPGLVTPTSMERVMQIAYSAKSNSGCISRQVGAVITDSNSSVKAIGWNDVPNGQVPCSLRTLDGLLHDFDSNTYSEYERKNSEFRDKSTLLHIKLIEAEVAKSGRPLSYCFKDIKNSIDEKGNQVHTRSLHAEENAFLQIAKYGGQAIKGGKLYTTASPCELCAKKAYQMEVAEIVFIDPYPGIARDHILSIGNKSPTLTQFRGAVGKGYHQLYDPTLAYKDELEMYIS